MLFGHFLSLKLSYDNICPPLLPVATMIHCIQNRQAVAEERQRDLDLKSAGGITIKKKKHHGRLL